MVIEIKPFDTLFFRDGKPFSLGEETWAEGIFPPLPSVIYGALRSAYFSENPKELHKANTIDDPSLKIKINGIFLKTYQYTSFPIPYDCINSKDKKESFLLISYDNINSTCCTEKILLSKQKSKGRADGFFSKNVFEKYLNQSKKTFNYPHNYKSEFLTTEPKIGIGRENLTHSTKESLLYRVGLVRTENLKIIVDFEGISLNEYGFLKLGGEGKISSYQKSNLDITFKKIELQKRFKLYFVTPAIFENGWLPSWIDKESLIGVYKEIKVKLVSASLGKFLSVGGYNMKSNIPKIMRKAVPAGSVYYFDIIEGGNDQIYDYFNYKTISDFNLGKQGFGITFVGGIR